MFKKFIINFAKYLIFRSNELSSNYKEYRYTIVKIKKKNLITNKNSNTSFVSDPLLRARFGFFMPNPFQRKPKRIRTAFTPGQLLRLEREFDKNHYVVGAERKQLASNLKLTETQVGAMLSSVVIIILVAPNKPRLHIFFRDLCVWFRIANFLSLRL